MAADDNGNRGQVQNRWLTHGTLSQDHASDGSSTDDNRGTLPWMQGVVYGAVGHLSPPERNQYAAHLERGGVSQLSDCLLAWSQATDLDRDAFRARFLGGAGSNTVVDHLRAASAGASSATTLQGQRNASGELATAWRLVGAARWPRFLADAHGRTMAATPLAGGPALRTQASTRNAAAGASRDGDAAGSSSPGRYIADDARRWIGQPSVGTGDCVPLIEAATGAAQSTEWRAGARVQGNTTIRPGTAIATFDDNGRYHGHAAIYLGQDEYGIQVIDQWNILDRNGRIAGQHPPDERTLPFGKPQRAFINRGDAYRVVEQAAHDRPGHCGLRD